MPGCHPPQPAFGAGNVYPLYPQAFAKTELNTLSPISEPASGSTPGAARRRANPAWQVSAAARRRRMEWLAISLPHNSSHLFARLPFGDAIQLAALVGTGQMTWSEVNAALNAKIKLAIAQLRAGSGERHARPDPHQAWEQARRAGEDEIWARYHAKCDAEFADDTTGDETDPWSTAQMRAREQVLSRLRGERDRALAALSCRLGPQPPRQHSAAQPAYACSARTHLTVIERDALRRLDASGFVDSHLMTDAIHDLATPLVATVERPA
jgi:hypothetical protein